MSDPLALAHACEQIARDLRALEAHRAECERDLATLIELGTVRASEHWRDGKYLYLIHPTDTTGQRKREYIGTAPDKIAAARAAMARHNAAEALRATLRQIREDTARAWATIGSAKWLIDNALVTTGARQEDLSVTKNHRRMVTPGASSSSVAVANQTALW